MPEPTLAIRIVKFSRWKRKNPPAWRATSGNADSTISDGKGFVPHTNCAAYTSSDDNIAVMTQTSTVAHKISRFGFSASSERVEMPSNPIYVSTAIDVPRNTPCQLKVCEL